MVEQKKVMIIAGGEWQVPLIKKAKELGHYVINTSMEENSVGFKYADVGMVANVLDKERNLEIAKQYQPDAVITDQSDIAVPTVAYLCEQLNLIGIGIGKAELFTNKYLMREFCKNNNFVYPKYKLCGSFQEVESFTEHLGFPLVLKPTDNQSSRGVNIVRAKDELEENYLDTLRHSRNMMVLVEEFIGGIELTVEGFKTKHKHTSLAVSKKSHLGNNKAVARDLFYSSANDLINYTRLKEMNDRLVEAMQLPFGITHAEYKYSEGEFYLIEIAARGGGTKISSHIIPLISGIDVNELLIRMALGEVAEAIEPRSNSVCAVLEFFVLSDGRVKQILGLEEIKAYQNVVDISLNFGVGDIISPPADDRSRHGYFIAFDKTEIDLRSLSEHIKDTLVIKYE